MPVFRISIGAAVLALAAGFCTLWAPPADAVTIRTEAAFKAELRALGLDDTKAHLVDEPERFSMRVVGDAITPLNEIAIFFDFFLVHWQGGGSLQTTESGLVLGLPPKVIPDDIVTSEGTMRHKTNPHPTDVAGGLVFWKLAWDGGAPATDTDSALHRSRVSDHRDDLIGTISGTHDIGDFGREITSWILTVNITHRQPVPPLPGSIPLPSSAILLLGALALICAPACRPCGPAGR